MAFEFVVNPPLFALVLADLVKHLAKVLMAFCPDRITAVCRQRFAERLRFIFAEQVGNRLLKSFA